MPAEHEIWHEVQPSVRELAFSLMAGAELCPGQQQAYSSPRSAAGDARTLLVRSYLTIRFTPGKLGNQPGAAAVSIEAAYSKIEAIDGHRCCCQMHRFSALLAPSPDYIVQF
jgi:hypothetical protein